MIQGTPALSNLMFAPQPGGHQGVSVGVGANAVSDQDYLVLSSGFRNSFSKVTNFEQFLKGKLDELLKDRGKGLDKSEIAAILLNVAKDFLTSNGFGFIINDAVEPILKRLINKLIQERQPTTPDTTPGPRPDIPSGGGRFEISGTIILTPSSSRRENPPTPSGSSSDQGDKGSPAPHPNRLP